MSDFDEDGKITKDDRAQLEKVVKDNTLNVDVTIDLPSKLYGQAKKVENTDEALMLSNVEFDLYQIGIDGVDFPEPKLITHLKTNEYGYATYTKGLIRGSYKLIETKSKTGYKFDPENPLTVDFEVDTSMYRTILTYNLENTGDDGLLLTKKDVATGALIPNTKFEIKNTETGEIVVTGTTDSRGVAWFKLDEGKYTYREYEAAPGYQIDEREFPFEIKKDGGIVKATMTNHKITTTPDGPGPQAPVGVIKFWIGGTAWNPNTGSYDVEAVAVNPVELSAMNYAGQGTTAQGNFTMYSIATMLVIALAMFISIKKKNEQEERVYILLDED